ncbi:MAG: HU family DNA-binding protein, partial [Actinomycetia bacterium]|nr:HU family DNA-binding protein [Actinomycetes bacterium]
MNRAEFIDNLAARLETNRAEANRALNAVLDEIKQTVSRGEEVRLSGLGIFESVKRGARSARNPQTGETVKVKATRVPKFRPSADFKALVAGARKAVTDRTSSAKKSAKKTAGKANTEASAAKKSATKKATAAKKSATKKATAAK